MPLQSVQKVSELVPETAPMIKRASLENHLPTGTREETIVSALELEYMVKVAHTGATIEDAERVCKAVDLYGVADEVRSHTQTMVKAANTQAMDDSRITREVSRAEDMITTQLSTLRPDIEKIAEASAALWDNYESKVSLDEVKLYAGAGRLVKEAAVLALNHRAKVTGEEEFTKVASVIEATDISQLTNEDNRAIASCVLGMEKEAGYTESNLYTDIFITKAAMVMIDLGSKQVDAMKLVALSDHVGSVLGDDIGGLLNEAHGNKAAIEALPMGDKQVIAGLVR